MDKAYEPKQYEDEIYKRWEQSGFFAPEVPPPWVDNPDNPKRPHFSIVLPPPNVTGTLHIGHAMMLAIEDLMVRYHRMKGDKTLWLPGTDHAAIATQTKVEKLLMDKGMKEPKKELGREKFLKEVDKFAKQSHDTIINQTKKMGSSLDWSREAFTLDEKRNLAVRTVFKKMYDDGLIYRGYRIVNWCPRCKSTLADDEVEYKTDKNAKLYWIKYGPFVLATTRPETKLGDTAVAVNPKDKRYQKMVGKKFMIPGVLGEFEITVVADDAVDMNFGSGAIKVTPYHSFADYEIAQRHKLPGKQIIDEDGKMMANCGKYAGLTTLEAREEIVKDMQKMGLIDHIDENYENNLSVCYRCGTAIEPIPSKQWFVDVNKKFQLKNSKLKKVKSGQEVSLKELMQSVVKSGEIKIIPDRFEKTYHHWIDNLRDWCISRQIWYGHQIPVYHCKQNCHPELVSGSLKKEMPKQVRHDKCDEPIVSIEEIEKCPRCGGEVTQDPDTLDTWFSSGLWTFSTLGYPNLKSQDLKEFHPTSVLETGYDILFFWVARMILMTTYNLGEIPFETVYLHGLVRDEQGRKMSKSLGNVIDPLDMTRKYGADATRLSLLIGNTPGNDTRLSEEKIAGFRNFTNKLWNIARYVNTVILTRQSAGKDPSRQSLRDSSVISLPQNDNQTLADKWILSRLNQITAEVTKAIDDFQFSMAGEKLRDFTWGDLADWYLEISKIEGQNRETPPARHASVSVAGRPHPPLERGGVQTSPPFKEGQGGGLVSDKSEILNYILNTILKLWHPFMPFVTEQIWSGFASATPDKAEMLMAAHWPDAPLFPRGGRPRHPTGQGGVAEDFGLIQSIITNIRSLRADNKIEPAKKLNVVISAGKNENLLKDNLDVIKGLARLEELKIEKKAEKITNSIGFVVGSCEVFLDLTGVIDLGKEKQRLEAEIKALEAYVEAQKRKLANPEFTQKAPPAVVEKERAKLKEAKEKLLKLQAQF